MTPTFSFRILALAAVLALPLAASPAFGQPAAIPDSAEGRARASFASFAESWMAKVRTMEAQARRNPTVRPGATGPLVTYRGYGDAFDTELRPTGHATAPYVGILRYEERVYSCSDAGASDCTVASVIPVTEIFRFQQGRWIY